MATYVVTDSVQVDWDDNHNYKYRHSSSDGKPVAQTEVNRRKAAKKPVVLWKWENHKPKLVEKHNI